MESMHNTTISMGKPIKSPELIPVMHRSTPTCINEPFMVNGEIFRVTCVSFGTPHGAVLVDDVEAIDVTQLGTSLGTHVLFPKGASIVFIQVLDKAHIKARLWHRGEGEIGFTPEAACVAMTAAKMLQKIMWESDVLMGGNNFHVVWNVKDDNVCITGLADLVKI